MRNGKQNYMSEITAAHNFILDHPNDIKLSNFIMYVSRTPNLIHSDRWSLVYDFMKENYPNNMDLVTGMTYWLE